MDDKRDRWNEFLSEHNDSFLNVGNTNVFYNLVAYSFYSALDMDGIISCNFDQGHHFLLAFEQFFLPKALTTVFLILLIPFDFTVKTFELHSEVNRRSFRLCV